MKTKIFLYSLAVSALILFSSYTFVGGDKGQILVKSMMRIMMYYHYQPQEIDDDFSEKVFDKYIERLDYSKRLFLQSEIDNLSLYREKIDDELQSESFEFFELASGIITHRIDKAEEYTADILSKPFDFSKDEVFNTDVENKGYAKTEAEIKDRWRRELKYKVLGRIVSAQERQAKLATKEEKGEEAEMKSLEELEIEARAKVKKDNDRLFKALKKIKDTDRQADYFNAITMTFDPHTNYYPPREKERFNQSITGRFEGIGASLLVDEEGLIKVVQIIPGSASSRQGELQPNDRIIKVGQSEEEPVDVVGMDLQDAIKMIKGPKGTEVRLTVRKPDGIEKVIPIVRDVVILEDTYAKSTIVVDKEKDTKIGFIHLPGFYADFTRSGGRNSAEDVAIELEKLKKEEVEGVVLDLRNNGGGSLAEVVEMVGLFVEKGPIVQVKGRDGDIRVMSDRNPSITYDGKLIVLVNSSSASASEILAAAIQDYDRGLIVGSKSTFGKGTVQLFLNLDDFIRGGEDIKPLGEIKLTTQKYYRINGGATQLKGVTPDVILPDVKNLIDTGEKDQDQAMPWDEIVPANYRKWDNPVSEQLSNILSHSEERVANNETFQLIVENSQLYKKRYDRNTYPLNLEAYKAYRKSLDEERKKYDNISKTIEEMDIKFVGEDYEYIHSDSSRLDRYNVWHRGLKKDAYVYEAVQIMRDMK